MPGLKRSFDTDAALRHVSEHCFTSTGSERVGIELELITYPSHNPSEIVDFPALKTAATSATSRGPLGAGSIISFEPGGQVEVSSVPHAGAASACMATAKDERELLKRLSEGGFSVHSTAIDPILDRPRVVGGQRYEAMERGFDSRNRFGRQMMRNTAALQVNIDLGGDGQTRWETAHNIGPMLIAAFANSPMAAGRPTPWKSTRMAIWSAIDPSRTMPALGASGYVADWTNFALAAQVLFMKATETRFVPITSAFSFRRWIEQGHELGYPTEDDFAYHLTTLFPPVRAKGWLEIRVIDSLPAPWWRVATALTCVLLQDADALDKAADLISKSKDLWTEAWSSGLDHPTLAQAADACFVAVMDAMPTSRVDITTASAISDYYERFIARRRTPADEQIDLMSAKIGP
ncbi:MAG: glutamate-cysteine ligase family protein [Actinomycetota bacterium]